MRETWHLRQILEDNFQVYTGRSAPSQVRYSSQFRVVVVSWWQQSPDTMIQGLSDLSWADLVICVNPETVPANGWDWPQTQQLAQTQFRNHNCVVIAGGTRWDHATLDLFADFGFFFYETWRGNQNQLPSWDFAADRPYQLEAMLGQARHYRSQFLQRLRQQDLIAHSLVNIYSPPGLHSSETSYRSPGLDQLESSLTREIFRTGHDAAGHVCDPLGPDRVWATCRIAPDIYRASWYSVVFETDDSTQINSQGKRVWTNFLSEKTAKVLYGSRIFVLFGTPGRLAALRRMGFETFADVIDESYDSEPDDDQRFERVWCAVQALVRQDPVQLYQQCRARLAHNHAQFQKVIQQPGLVAFVDQCVARYSTTK